MRKKFTTIDDVVLTITSLNERGYGVSEYNERKVLVLDAIPGEELKVKIFNKKKGNYLAEKVEVIKASPYREAALETHFLSCSPWQTISFPHENEFKKDLIKKFYFDNSVEIPDFDIANDQMDFHYRNKMEYSFYAYANERISVAVHKRESSFHKDPIESCVLAPQKINSAIAAVVKIVNDLKFHARELKGLQLRYSFYEDKSIAVLFIKDGIQEEKILQNTKTIEKILAEFQVNGFIVIFSDPKMSAYVETKIIKTFGEIEILECVIDKSLYYGYNNFFQVNPSVFSLALKDIINSISSISDHKNRTAADIYAGVGTIGLSISNLVKHVYCVEITEGSEEYFKKNAEKNKIINADFRSGMAEKIGLSLITPEQILLLDPPRSGLHPDVIYQITRTLPEDIIYLSCNPKTQAEDIAKFITNYDITFFKAYNFYPHTPHVETLCVMKRKK